MPNKNKKEGGNSKRGRKIINLVLWTVQVWDKEAPEKEDNWARKKGVKGTLCGCLDEKKKKKRKENWRRKEGHMGEIGNPRLDPRAG